EEKPERSYNRDSASCEGEMETGIRSQESGVSIQGIPTPDSCLLTPVKAKGWRRGGEFGRIRPPVLAGRHCSLPAGPIGALGSPPSIKSFDPQITQITQIRFRSISKSV